MDVLSHESAKMGVDANEDDTEFRVHAALCDRLVDSRPSIQDAIVFHRPVASGRVLSTEREFVNSPGSPTRPACQPRLFNWLIRGIWQW